MPTTTTGEKKMTTKTKKKQREVAINAISKSTESKQKMWKHVFLFRFAKNRVEPNEYIHYLYILYVCSMCWRIWNKLCESSKWTTNMHRKQSQRKWNAAIRNITRQSHHHHFCPKCILGICHSSHSHFDTTKQNKNSVNLHWFDRATLVNLDRTRRKGWRLERMINNLSDFRCATKTKFNDFIEWNLV